MILHVGFDYGTVGIHYAQDREIYNKDHWPISFIAR